MWINAILSNHDFELRSSDFNVLDVYTHYKKFRIFSDNRSSRNVISDELRIIADNDISVVIDGDFCCL